MTPQQRIDRLLAADFVSDTTGHIATRRRRQVGAGRCLMCGKLHGNPADGAKYCCC